ncbi:MAG: flavodoxin [Clostridiales bacterium]|nr:flavodoxin [Clostridiales bacterium]
MIKKLISVLLGAALMLVMAGCTSTASSAAPQQGDTVADGRTLVVYFSVSGNTKSVAEVIAEYTGADLYEIIPAEPYTDADLDWNDQRSRTSVEQNDHSARPGISSDPISMEDYTTVYIGYPIWHGQEPRIMDTFVESYSFGTARVIPFCTSGSSDIGNSGIDLARNATGGNWLDGRRFAVNASPAQIKKWVDSL